MRPTLHKVGGLTVVCRTAATTREAMAESRHLLSLRKLWNATIKEPLPPDIMKLLDELQ